MKNLILSLFAFVLFSSSLPGQNPVIWKKTYNNSSSRDLRDMFISDTSIYLLSETQQDVELINVNKQTGNLNFSKLYTGSSIDYPFRMYKTNSSIIISGETGSHEGVFNNSKGSWDVFSLKTDLTGNLLDTAFFGGSLADHGGFSKLSNNKYICSGISESINGDLSFCNPTINMRSWVFISDSTGNIQRYKCNDTVDNFMGSFYFQNGHYYLFTSGTFMKSGGYTYNYPPNSQGNPGGPSSDFLVVEYDTMLNIINVKNYGSDSNEQLFKFIKTVDNGFMLFGYTDYIHDTLEVSGGQGGRDFYCVKLDSNANFQWSKCYGTTGNDNGLADITQTSDNGYLIAATIYEASGNVSKFFGKSDIWLAKIDSAGNLLWERTFGGSYYDHLVLVREDSDGSIFIAGETMSNNGTFAGCSIQGMDDLFVIKLASWVGINNSRKNGFKIKVCPNPTRPGALITLTGLPVKNNRYQLSIFNVQGRLLNNQAFSAGYSKQIQLPMLAKGLYFIRLTNEDGIVHTAKFIIE
jgi:hypothetical protein